MSDIAYYSGFSINDEDDLIVFLANILNERHQRVYAKVKIISRNIEVTPDIDVLNITSSENTIGYETKVIKYHKTNKRYIYQEIYKGIGQALLYLNYGIDKAYLVMAYQNNYEIPLEKRQILEKKINDVLNSVTGLGLSKYLGLDIIEIFPTHLAYHNVLEIDDKMVIEKDSSKFAQGLKAGRRMIRLPESFHLCKQCLLSNQFSYSKLLSKKVIHYTKLKSPPHHNASDLFRT